MAIKWFKSNEIYKTSSGRYTTPFPKIPDKGKSQWGRFLNKNNAWLIENTILEAEARGNRLVSRIFSNENPKNFPPASQESALLFLFGEYEYVY